MLKRSIPSPAVIHRLTVQRCLLHRSHHVTSARRVPFILNSLSQRSKPCVLQLHHAHVHSSVTRFIAPSLISLAKKAETPETTTPEESSDQPVPCRFDTFDTISGPTQKAIAKVFEYQTMTAVQEAVITKLPNKNDMFVKAKTGTGKTLAFLIGAIETAIEGKSLKELREFQGASILIVSPTRELAHQIADEATKVTQFYPFKVHCLVGGESKSRQMRSLERHRCDIVVGTPGRLNDMLRSFGHFRKMCQYIKVLILDEADQLLDMGFKREILDILSFLPKERQTMLYSATLSPEIRKNIVQFALSPDYELIDTVSEEDVNTHLHVKQSVLVAPHQDQIALIANLLRHDDAATRGKTIVFLPTTKATILYAAIFKRLLPDRPVLEIHSNKNQDSRTRISTRFRSARPGTILFTTDVSARGVDYPDVSLVLQVGMPSSRDQYIHRLGRTGRAGKSGEGMLVLAPFEKGFVNEIKDLPVEKRAPSTLSPEEAQESSRVLQQITNRADETLLHGVYTAFLGYYAGRMDLLPGPRSKLIEYANSFYEGLGLVTPPSLSPRYLELLGLSDRSRGRPSRNTSDRRGSFPDRSSGPYFGSRESGEYRGDRRERFDRRERRNDSDRRDFGNRRNRDDRSDRGVHDGLDNRRDRRDRRFSSDRGDRGDRSDRDDRFRRYRVDGEDRKRRDFF